MCLDLNVRHRTLKSGLLVIGINNFLLNNSLFTKGERSLIFSSLKKSSFLKSMLLLNFLIQ